MKTNRVLDSVRFVFRPDTIQAAEHQINHKTTWSRIEKLAVVLLFAGFAFGWNWHFLQNASLPQILQMNDVGSILDGYHRAPHLWPDSLRWWNGSWIQTGISAFRPLASYLYWGESWIGLRYGFVWVGWIGFLLFLGICGLVCCLAWRLSRSKLCVLMAAIFCPAISFQNQNSDFWLVWYPVHQELLIMLFVLGAVLRLVARKR